MDYRALYRINRQVHGGPFLELMDEVLNILKDHDVDLKVRNSEGSERGTQPIDCRSTMALLTNGIGSRALY